MTSTLCQSAMLTLIIALWVTKFVEFSALAVKAVLPIPEIVRPTLPGACEDRSAAPGALVRLFWPIHARRFTGFFAAIVVGTRDEKMLMGQQFP